MAHRTFVHEGPSFPRPSLNTRHGLGGGYEVQALVILAGLVFLFLEFFKKYITSPEALITCYVSKLIS